MKLYTYFRSSAAYRVRIALGLKEIAHELVPIHMYRDGGLHRTEEYGAKNPQHLVPTLELDDGTFIPQSIAIIEYLDAVHGGPKLVPADPLEAARVRAASFAIACDVHPLNNLRVMNYIKGPLGHSEDDVKVWYAHWILNGGLDAVERMIEGGPFCFGTSPTMADCCLIPQIFNARRFEVPLDRFPKILAVDRHCAELSAFQAAHPAVQVDAE